VENALDLCLKRTAIILFPKVDPVVKYVRIVWDTMKSALEPDDDRAGGRTDRGENAIAGQAWLLLSLGHDGIMNGGT
jgi:hypothetical protein